MSNTSGFPIRREYVSREDDSKRFVILRFNNGFIELYAELVYRAEQELLRKASYVKAEMDDFTAAERLAYQVLANTF